MKKFFTKLFASKSGYILKSFSNKRVNLSQIGSYIVELYKTEGLSCLGYDTININGIPRYIITSKHYNPKNVQYFKDRCPAMVEQEALKMNVHYPHYIYQDEDGFKQVIVGEIPKEILKGDSK